MTCAILLRELSKGGIEIVDWSNSFVLVSFAALTSVYGAPTLCTEDNTISVRITIHF